MNKDIFVVLMAGGIGSRFWPYSRNAKPKQFLDVLGTGKSLLQTTYERFLPVCRKENIFVVTSQEHWALACEQLPELHARQILAEPSRRNTAPCILYAAKKIASLNPNAILVVGPTDHLILQEEEFCDTIKQVAEQAAAQDKLVTLGIQPTRAEIGYGYIQYREGDSPLKKVKTFTEKPESALAKKFLESGDFVWNAGIFVWGVQAILEAISTHLPEMTEIFADVTPALDTPAEKAAIELAYAQTRNISIDYGVLEKAENVYVWLCRFSWSDLGSWGSLFDYSAHDENNNAVTGEALIYDSKNCLIKGEPGKLIVVQGLDDFLIGSFDNVVIVCKKDNESLFRKMVTELKNKTKGSEYL